MEDKKIKTVKTTRGELRYYRDWDNSEGGIVMENAQTIRRYREIQDQHPKCDEFGVFFAFSKKQYNEGVARLKELGFIKDESELRQDRLGGLIGTAEGIRGFLDFYKERDKAIPVECDPQEVYFYEFNNYESMYAWDGDLEAIKVIIEHWGAEVARSIIRFDACKSIDAIVKSY